MLFNTIISAALFECYNTESYLIENALFSKTYFPRGNFNIKAYRENIIEKQEISPEEFYNYSLSTVFKDPLIFSIYIKSIIDSYEEIRTIEAPENLFFIKKIIIRQLSIDQGCHRWAGGPNLGLRNIVLGPRIFSEAQKKIFFGF